jgi:hypothetical protein
MKSTIKKDEFIKEARNYKDKGQCFAVVRNDASGSGFEVLLSGDSQSLLFGVSCIIDRFSKLQGISPEMVIDEISEIIKFSKSYTDRDKLS